MKHIIVGTAGHIDHGKTALVKALTGIDADRLKEEKQRGITIDIGFAFLPLSDDVELGIIDVPGHEKFVKNMLAGVGGIDLAILVIAADEGIMPQTEEHLAICDLLQIQHGLVALTKIDLVDDEWLEMVQEDVREGLVGSFLAQAPIVPVSSKTGSGLEKLRRELNALAMQVRERNSEGLLRLPIDRVFSIKGFGTVATGTLVSGSVRSEDVLELLPSKIKLRVRNVQVHDKPVEQAYAGQRTALNLHGAEKSSIQRGDVLCEAGRLSPTHMIDAFLSLTPKAPRSVKYRTRVRFHHGTHEIMARVILFDREELLPGESAYVQFRFDTPLVAMARDRYIIRSYSPIITIGGGEILYVHPKKHKHSSNVLPRLKVLKNGSLEEILSLYVHDAKFQPISASHIAGLLAVPESEIQAGLGQLLEQGELANVASQRGAVLHRTQHQLLTELFLRELEQFHAQTPLKPGMSKEELRKKLPADLSAQLFQDILEQQVQAGNIILEGNLVRKSEYCLQLSARQEQLSQQLETIYQKARFQPPSRKDALQQLGSMEKEGQEIFSLLIDRGMLVRIEGELYFHHAILAEITQLVVDFLRQHQEISIGDLKNLLQSSRKYTVPIMAYLDAQNITMRQGDVRVLRQT